MLQYLLVSKVVTQGSATFCAFGIAGQMSYIFPSMIRGGRKDNVIGKSNVLKQAPVHAESVILPPLQIRTAWVCRT